MSFDRSVHSIIRSRGFRLFNPLTRFPVRAKPEVGTEENAENEGRSWLPCTEM